MNITEINLATTRCLGTCYSTAEFMLMNMLFWAVPLCSSERVIRFVGTYRFHIQGRRISQARNLQKQATNHNYQFLKSV
jgi:hypothetical protein